MRQMRDQGVNAVLMGGDGIASQEFAAIAGPGVSVTQMPDGLLSVTGMPAEQIGDAAFRNGVPLYELSPVRASLEQAYLELTQDEVEFRAEVAA